MTDQHSNILHIWHTPSSRSGILGGGGGGWSFRMDSGGTPTAKVAVPVDHFRCCAIFDVVLLFERSVVVLVPPDRDIQLCVCCIHRRYKELAVPSGIAGWGNAGRKASTCHENTTPLITRVSWQILSAGAWTARHLNFHSRPIPILFLNPCCTDFCFFWHSPTISQGFHSIGPPPTGAFRSSSRTICPCPSTSSWKGESFYREHLTLSFFFYLTPSQTLFYEYILGMSAETLFIHSRLFLLPRKLSACWWPRDRV